MIHSLCASREEYHYASRLQTDNVFMVRWTTHNSFFNVLIQYCIKYLITTQILGKNNGNRENPNGTDRSMIKQGCDEKSDCTHTQISSSSSSEKSSSEKLDPKFSLNIVTSELGLNPHASSSKTIGHTVLSPTATKPSLRRRNTTGPGMIFPATDPPSYSSSMVLTKSSPLQSPHFDKRFFDSSLVEMRSQASSSSTLDYDSNDEIWVRRIDFIQERKKKVSYPK